MVFLMLRLVTLLRSRLNMKLIEKLRQIELKPQSKIRLEKYNEEKQGKREKWTKLKRNLEKKLRDM